MKYLYIPVDSRPCNNLFPVQLAQLQRIEVAIPPREASDDFTCPADHEALKKWMWANSEGETSLILSVDNYVLGSLLNSRKSDVSIETCMERLEELCRLKAERPGLHIYAFTVLMRTSISTLSQEAIVHWKLVNEYSQVCHKLELYGNSEDHKRKVQLEQEIPADILAAFLSSRHRNAEVNRRCVEFAGDGIFELLAIVQEDSTLYGIHKTEQKLLEKLITRCRAGDRVHIHNGTDEAGCLLMARAIAEEQKRSIRLSYLYLNDNRESFVASYEDRLFHENLLSHACTAGITLKEGDGETDVLVIYTPAGQQYEASLGDGTPPCDYKPQELEAFAEQIAELIKRGKRIYLLDVAYANGGQGDILYRIHKRMDVTGLAGYSAWNTASNALGTIFAQAVLNQGADEKENRRFTLERLLDDYAYQGVLRKRLEHQLKAEGEDTLHLRDKSGAEDKLQKLMDSFLKKDAIFSGKVLHVNCTLPWPRIFEARILVEEV